jgi:hypothetical protein
VWLVGGRRRHEPEDGVKKFAEARMLFDILCGAFVIALIYYILAHWYPRRRSEQALDYDYAINFDDLGVRLTNLRKVEDQVHQVLWSDVCRVVAYKVDLLMYDMICIYLTRADGTGVELDEHMAGWNGLMINLHELLPGCTPYDDWWHPVAVPAFKTNETVIFSLTPPNW